MKISYNWIKGKIKDKGLLRARLMFLLLFPLKNIYASASVGVPSRYVEILIIMFLLTIPMIIITTHFFTQGKKILLKIMSLCVFYLLFFSLFFIFPNLIFPIIFILGFATIATFLRLLKKKRISIMNFIFFLIFLFLFLTNILLFFYLFIINTQ